MAGLRNAFKRSQTNYLPDSSYKLRCLASFANPKTAMKKFCARGTFGRLNVNFESKGSSIRIEGHRYEATDGFDTPCSSLHLGLKNVGETPATACKGIRKKLWLSHYGRAMLPTVSPVCAAIPSS